MKKIILVIFGLLAALYGEAEEEGTAAVRTIRGVVLDEKGQPLAGASVWVKGTTIGAGANTDGEFVITLRREGGEQLYVSFTGYIPQEYTLKAEEGHSLEFRLKPALNALDEAVITGTRTYKPLKEVPVLTRVVSQEDILRVNPMDLQSLLEYEMPGLQFGRAHGSNLPTLKFQGAEGSYVLFLLDGERMAGEGASNNPDFERINIDDVERIEIVRGAMSTLYGSSAMGGVVNIITRNANRPFSATVSGRYSSEGEQKYSASAGSRQNRFSALSSVTYRTEDAFEVTDNEGPASMAGYEIWSASQKLGYAFSGQLKMDLTGSYYRNNQLELVKGKEQEVYMAYSVNPKLRYLFHENHFLNITYLLDDYQKQLEYKAAPTNKIYDEKENTLRVEYSGTIGGRHLLTAGLEVNAEKLKHYRLRDSSSRRTQNYVVFAQEDWKVSDNFSVVAGVRADCHSKFGCHASPKLSLLYRAGNFTFRGGYAMGFRLPSLRELYEEYNMGGQNLFIIHGNEDLKTETSHQGSLSVEINRGIFNGTVSGYYNKFYDKIAMRLLHDGTSDQQYYNTGNAQTSGVDVTGQLRLNGGLTLKVAYSFVDDAQETDGYNTSSTRPHSLTFNALYARLFGKIRVSAAFNGRWISKVDVWDQQSDDSFVKDRLNGRTICSMNLAGNFPRGFRLSFQVDNLFDFRDKKISADSSITPERGIAFTGTLAVNVADLFKL